MLNLTIQGDEFYDETSETFLSVDVVELVLEHSLISLSKWESQTKKPFLSRDEKTPEEVRLYIKAMIISDNYPPDIVDRFTQEDMSAVNAYIDSSESATKFGSMPETGGRGEVVTSELIYYWMVMFNIPFECQTWHLNRLFSLIRICNLKNSKPKKMSRQELAARNRALNEQRREQLNTNG
jgi:hypothetical protein